MRINDSPRALERRGDVLIDRTPDNSFVAQDYVPRAPLKVPRERLLMCAPDYFGVDYVINPWMEGQVGKAVRTLAQAQWKNLRRHVAREASIEFIAPALGLPDMVFTANGGLAIGNKAVVSRFRADERRGEEPLFWAYFKRRAYEIAHWPEDVAFEGAGDALVDRARPLIWCGHGFRSSQRAPRLLEEIFDRETISLRLVDPRFYHLDTCFCPLDEGWLLYFPGAFDEASQMTIARHTQQDKRIEVGEADATAFSCNAVEIGRRVYMNGASNVLQARLRAAGFTPLSTPLGEFVKAGGGAKCLTLNLTAT